MDFRQHRLQFIDMPRRLLDFGKIHVPEFRRDDEILLIGRANRLFRTEFIEIFVRRQRFQLFGPQLVEPFHAANEIELLLGCLIGVDEEAVDFISPHLRPLEGRIDVRRDPMLDLVGEFNDFRGLRLAEHLGQPQDGDCS